MTTPVAKAGLVSSNGYRIILSADSGLIRPWIIGPVTLQGRTGPLGFTLAHFATWFHEEIERLWPNDMPDHDDHWYGQRWISGTNPPVPSNHYSATAIDLNAARHPQFRPVLDTFTVTQAKRIRTKLADKYEGLIEWGGDWSAARVDAMHFEHARRSATNVANVRALALELVNTPLGRRVLKAQTEPVNWQKW